MPWLVNKMTIKIRSHIKATRAKHLTVLDIEEHESDETQHTCDINLRLPFTGIETADGEKIKDSLYISGVTADETALLIGELERLHEIIKRAEDENFTDGCNVDTKIIAQHYFDSDNKKYIEINENKR